MSPKFEAAKQYLDRAEPLHCEVVALEEQLKRMRPETGEYAAASAGLEQAKARVKAYYQATWPEYIALLMELPFEERKKIYSYSDAVGERCAAKRNPWTVDKLSPV